MMIDPEIFQLDNSHVKTVVVIAKHTDRVMFVRIMLVKCLCKHTYSEHSVGLLDSWSLSRSCSFLIVVVVLLLFFF